MLAALTRADTDALRTRLQEQTRQAAELFAEDDTHRPQRDKKLGEKNPDTVHWLVMKHSLAAPQAVAVGTQAELLSDLNDRSITSWKGLTAALLTPLENARRDAARELSP